MDGHCYTVVGCALQEAQLQRGQHLTHCCRNWKAVHHMEADLLSLRNFNPEY